MYKQSQVQNSNTLSSSFHYMDPRLYYFLLSLITLCAVQLVLSTNDHESKTYIIHMDLSSMPKAYSSQHNWYLATLDGVSSNVKLTTADIPASSKHVYTYINAIHGFSAILSPAELQEIQKSPGYISFTRDLPVKLDTTRSSQFLGLNSESGAWPESSYGKDVIIGVIDTGISPESKSYSDDGIGEIPSRWNGECESGTEFNSSLCNKKLIGARYFNKGLLAKEPNLTIAMNSARDTEGHGTHTSSTAAGNYVNGASYFGYAAGTARGMAPHARVAMYKALFDEGVDLSDIIAAIDQAITDGVDVLSLSLGLDGVSLHEDPIAIATFAALEKGIFVSTSAGNEGPYLESLHNGIPWVLTVAAGTIDREYLGNIILGNGNSITGSSLYPGNSSLSNNSIVFMDKCENSEELKKAEQKIVVCLDTNDTLNDQIYHVQNTKGLVGAVFITNNTDLEFFIQSPIPAVFLNPRDGEIVIDYIKKNSEPKAELEFQETRLGIKPAPIVSSYSSRGPSPSCPFVLKPDLMAPGDLILAAWPNGVAATDLAVGPVFSNFNLLSGTSMSCPHATGVAALLKGAHPEWSPAAIRSAMMTTSYDLDNTFMPIKDGGNILKPATPFAMGAGHIDPNKALNPGLIYDVKSEDYINLLCALNYTMKQIQVIARTSSFSCSNASLDLNYPSFIAFFNANDSKSDDLTVQEFRRTVTNVGDENSSYEANLSGMNGLKVSVVPEKLVFKEKNEKKSYKLRIESTRLLKDLIVFGFLSWTEKEGKYAVRSPIVATRLNSEILMSGKKN